MLQEIQKNKNKMIMWSKIKKNAGINKDQCISGACKDVHPHYPVPVIISIVDRIEVVYHGEVDHEI